MIIRHIAFVKGTVYETQRIITVAFLLYFNLDMMQLPLKISDVVHIYSSPDRLAKIHWPVSCARKAVLSIQYWCIYKAVAALNRGEPGSNGL